jgi:hypothetical protein
VNRVVKLADTLVFAFIVTLQPPIPLHAPPQPERPQAMAGLAVNVTCVPAAKLALQVEPQSIPAGELVTVPPAPMTETVSEEVCVNVAKTFCAAFMVTTQLPAPLQAPSQPLKLQPLAGVALKVTCVPTGKFELDPENETVG